MNSPAPLPRHSPQKKHQSYVWEKYEEAKSIREMFYHVGHDVSKCFVNKMLDNKINIKSPQKNAEVCQKYNKTPNMLQK